MNKNERIQEIRKSLGLTMDEFGARLGVGRSAISHLEKGNRNLSDQMCRSICREFGVNEIWLLTGEGEMLNELSKKEMISEFFADVLTDPEDSFRVRFVEMLSQMTVEDWEYIGEMMKRILKKEES